MINAPALHSSKDNSGVHSTCSAVRLRPGSPSQQSTCGFFLLRLFSLHLCSCFWHIAPWPGVNSVPQNSCSCRTSEQDFIWKQSGPLLL